MQKEETNENQSFNTNNQKYRKKQAQTTGRSENETRVN